MIDCTAFVESLQGKPVAVFGLGLSGLSVVEALSQAGARVLAWDDKAQSCEAAKNFGAEIVVLDEGILRSCAVLVLAPGVPLTFPQPHAVVLAAHVAGIEIIGDLEILHRQNNKMAHGRKTVGITGTNGKSTTTALIAHILQEAGRPVAMGGNIGKPVLALEMPPEDGVFVIEISSYQMDLCPSFRPDIGVLLNITPDHLDRHGTFEAYATAKEHMFGGAGVAVIGMEDAPSSAICAQIKRAGTRQVLPFTVTDEIAGLREAFGLSRLKGLHNYQNVLAAYHVCHVLGLSEEEIFAGLKTFAGLAHRQFLVRVLDGIAYINDSKATNAEAAGKALSAYQNIYWILGGLSKAGGLDGLEPLMPHVKHAFLIGAAMEDFGTWLDRHGVAHNFSETLDKAVQEAHDMAQGARGQPGGAGVVLLSPACASFDQFKSFEERGDVFAALVEGLT